ncbi:hypothetical protein [Arthrobacter pigmenti]
MDRRKWLGAIAVAALLMTGCGASASDSSGSPHPQASHTMADGTVMSGAEHGSDGTESAPAESHKTDGGKHAAGHEGSEAQAEQVNAQGPSDAARMICAGQVVGDISAILGAEGVLTPSSSWEKPMFTCTYELDGKPLVLSVHDATAEAQGRKHFAQLRKSLDNAKEIQGMAALGMPAISDGDGIVAFVRDGKTLVVDATALPDGLGPNNSKTQADAAYAVASAVLVCWVHHA